MMGVVLNEPRSADAVGVALNAEDRLLTLERGRKPGSS